MSDNYMHVKGAQITKQEREWLYNCAKGAEKLFGTPTIVNIGVAWGATMHALRAGSSKAKLIGVDIDYKKRQVVRPGDLRAELLEGDSGIIGTLWDDPIHLLFIDGCHYFGTVLADIMTWGHHVVVGGTVLFHDYSPTSKNLKLFPDLAGVRAAVEFWNKSKWEPMKAPGSLAMFIRRYKDV